MNISLSVDSNIWARFLLKIEMKPDPELPAKKLEFLNCDII